MSRLHPRHAEIVEWLRTLDVPALTGKTPQQVWEDSYQTWARNGRAWDRRLAAGGTYTLRAICWYQQVHRPGSTDSRPGPILAAICDHLDAPAEAAS